MTRWLPVVLTVILTPPAVGAPGHFLAAPSDTIRIVDQSAILIFADGWEELSLTARVVGPEKSFAWLIPVPSPPQVLPMATEAFEALSADDGTQLSERARYRGGCPPPVTRLAQPKGIPHRNHDWIGSEESLATWARRHKLQLPKSVMETLRSLWSGQSTLLAVYYVAHPQRPDTVLPDTVVVGPIRLRFRTMEPVYPASVNLHYGSAPDMRLYLISDTRLVPKDGCHDWAIDIQDSASLPGSIFFTNGSFIRGTISLPGVADPDSHFVRIPNPPRLLTRARGSLQSGFREHIRFRAYDPVTELQRPEWPRRTTAATIIGREHTEGGFEALESFLARSRGWCWDVYSALWAVGQLAEDRSGEVLSPWVEHDDPDCRFEALAAMEACGAQEGLNPSLNILVGPVKTHGSSDGGLNMGMKHTAMRIVCRSTDSSTVTVLRESAARHDGRHAWLFGWKKGEDYTRYCFGLHAVTALAAMGEPEAIQTILEGVRKGAKAHSDSALIAQAQTSSGRDRFTWEQFWLFPGIRAPYAQSGWKGLWSFLQVSRPVPGLQKVILETLLADPGISDAGKVCLMAALPGRTEAHFDSLETIWNRALLHGKSETTLYLWCIGDRYVPARVNLTALAAVQALERFHRVDQLARLLPEAEAKDPFLAMEIARCLARMKEQTGLDFCEAHVEHEWPHLATAQEYRVSIELFVTRRDPPIWMSLAGFDCSRYTREMARYLKLSRGAEYWRDRMTDRTDPVFLRLMWMTLANTPEELQLARLELRRLEAEGIMGPLVESACRRIEAWILEHEDWLANGGF